MSPSRERCATENQMTASSAGSPRPSATSPARILPATQRLSLRIRTFRFFSSNRSTSMGPVSPSCSSGESP
eukprot:11174659-Lingulodinium_polyedra.AAC.1